MSKPLIEYFEQGIIKELFLKGAVNVNFMTYHRYYQVFDAYRKKGNPSNKSYQLAADECGCSERTIIRAVKAMTK